MQQAEFIEYIDIERAGVVNTRCQLSFDLLAARGYPNGLFAPYF
jgi:hypothetical protein